MVTTRPPLASRMESPDTEIMAPSILHKRAGGARRLAGPRSERRGQRLADEQALPGPRDALPVRLDQRLAAHVAGDQQRGERELHREVARLRHRAVAAGGARLEPAQRAHLLVAGEHAAARG